MKLLRIMVVSVCLLMSSVAFAGQARTGDITIDSDVDEVTTTASDEGTANVDIHSIDVSSGRTGNISIKGKVDEVNTTAKQGGTANVRVGSVKVGQ